MILKFYFRIRRRKRIRRKALNPKRYLELKESARALVLTRLDSYNQHYRYKIGKVAIRNQRSRWGSCSSKGNLNFNYKIILLPVELQDYIIVHELCHLKQFNHSKDFWDLVAETIPQWQKLRAHLLKMRL